jgi:hypothetical protein
VQANVPRAFRAHPLVAGNTLLVLHSVWPQSVAYWEDIGQYVCRLRGCAHCKLTAVMFGDEYQQAPPFIYTQVDAMFKTYVSMQQLQHAHVRSIPLGFKRGFWSSPLVLNGAEVHSGDWRRQYRYDSRLLEVARDFLCNFIGNALASQARLDMIRAIQDHWDFFSACFYKLTQMWNDEAKGMDTAAYRQVLADSSFTLCPGGGNFETYRISEALEAGSIPVLESDEVFEIIYPLHPMPYSRSFAGELQEALQDLLISPHQVTALRQQVTDYWMNLKVDINRQFRQAMSGLVIGAGSGRQGGRHECLAHLADSLAHLEAAIVQEHGEQRKVKESADRVHAWRFDAWDVDKSGAIDRKELKDAFGTLALGHSDLQISEMFDKNDENKDGKITFAEFQKARQAPI